MSASARRAAGPPASEAGTAATGATGATGATTEASLALAGSQAADSDGSPHHSATRLFGDTAAKLVRDAVRERSTGSLMPYKDDAVRDIVLELKHLVKQFQDMDGLIAAIQADPHGAGLLDDVHNDNDNNDINDDDINHDDNNSDDAVGRAKAKRRQAQGKRSRLGRPAAGSRMDASYIPALQSAKLLHYHSIARNKQSVLAYQRCRLDRITRTLWTHGGGASTASALPASLQHHISLHESEFAADYCRLASNLRGQFLDIDLGAGLLPPRDVFTEVRVVRDCGEVMTEGGPLLLETGTQHFLKRTDVEDLIRSGDVQEV
ncbi:hypothetical protein BC831DRAFT_463381 [Entophlyctis helioformis]|nr:hypothetical protein BC831DRAFT_463381 [Entophlyctis helioformis]